jgi:hypothetical protein
MTRLSHDCVRCSPPAKVWAVFLGVVLSATVGCEDKPTIAPEQRMRVITLAEVDRLALAAPQFDAFREALMRVRMMELQRPVSDDGPVPAPTLATFYTELEAVTIPVITIIRTDGWTWDDRQLMNRALRGASSEDLTTPPG